MAAQKCTGQLGKQKMMLASTKNSQMIPLTQYTVCAIFLTTRKFYRKPKTTEIRERGAEKLNKVAKEVHLRVHGWAPTTLCIART
jgi:hypothetical protein